MPDAVLIMPAIKTTFATFVDNTEILTSLKDQIFAARNLQNHQNTIQFWLKTSRIKVNESKSVHVHLKYKHLLISPTQ